MSKILYSRGVNFDLGNGSFWVEILKAGPLEAVLVIFGRRALIFCVFESS